MAGTIGEASAATGVNGDQNDNSVSQAVHVFLRNDEKLRQQAYLKLSNTTGAGHSGVNDVFGIGISISVDGNALAVVLLERAALQRAYRVIKATESLNESPVLPMFSRTVMVFANNWLMLNQ